MLNIEEIKANGIENLTWLGELPTIEELQQLMQLALNPKQAWTLLQGEYLVGGKNNPDQNLAAKQEELLTHLIVNYHEQLSNPYISLGILPSMDFVQTMLGNLSPERVWNSIVNKDLVQIWNNSRHAIDQNLAARQEELLTHLIVNYHEQLSNSYISLGILPSMDFFQTMLGNLPPERVWNFIVNKDLVQIWNNSRHAIDQNLVARQEELLEYLLLNCAFTNPSACFPMQILPSIGFVERMIEADKASILHRLLQFNSATWEYDEQGVYRETPDLVQHSNILIGMLEASLGQNPGNQIPNPEQNIVAAEVNIQLPELALVVDANEAINPTSQPNKEHSSILDLGSFADNEASQVILREHKKKQATELEYQQMRDFSNLYFLDFLPSRSTLENMIWHGLSPNKALDLVTSSYLKSKFSQDAVQELVFEDQKKQLLDLIYSKMTDFRSLWELEFMPSRDTLETMLQHGLNVKQALVLINRVIDEATDNKWILEDQRDNLLLPVLVKAAIRQDLGIGAFHFDKLPSKSIVDLVVSYGQKAIDKMFSILLQFTPKSIEERADYEALKKHFAEKYNASPEYALKQLKESSPKERVVFEHQDGVTDPIFREGVALINGKEVKFRFFGTEHHTSQTTLPDWMRQIASESDHLFYEGMSGLRIKYDHDRTMASGQKYSFSVQDKQIFKRIATLYKNTIVGEEGEVTEEDVASYLSLFNINIQMPRTSFNSAEHAIKLSFPAQHQTMLEETLLQQHHDIVATTNKFQNVKDIWSKIEPLKKRLEVLSAEMRKGVSHEIFQNICKEREEILDKISLISENLALKPDNFKQDGSINLSSLHEQLKLWEIYFRLQDAGIEIFAKLPRNFSEGQGMIKQCFTADIERAGNDFFLAATRNKLWVEEIIQTIREHPEISSPLIVSGLAHTPGLIVELMHRGVKFSPEVEEDAYRFVLECQMLMPATAYNTLLRVNNYEPAAQIDEEFIQCLSQMDQGPELLLGWYNDKSGLDS